MEAKKAYEDLQKRRKQVPEDTLLAYTPLDKLLHCGKTVFVTLPKTVWRGLKGADDFTFSEGMLIAKVPYYLGGVFLALSPFLGGNRREGVRQATAVALYLLGIGATHWFTNTLYRWRYGVDLTMLYRSKNGQVEQVFSSNDFPRFDLLTPALYTHMAKKMGIPPEVYEQDGAVREQLRHIIANSRALKLIVGNVLSAVGAGYLARSDVWLKLPAIMPVIRDIWRQPGQSLLSRVRYMAATCGEALNAVLKERLCLVGAARWQKVLILGSLATLVGAIATICSNGVPKKQYSIGRVGPLDEYALSRPQSVFRPMLYPMDTMLPWQSGGTG